MHTFFSPRFSLAVLTSCAAFLLTMGGTPPAAAATPPPEAPLSQDRQALLKNKKYQQGLKALEDRLPLEASKHFQECLNSKIPESHHPPLPGGSPDPRQKNGRRADCLGTTSGLLHEIILDGGGPL